MFIPAREFEQGNVMKVKENEDEVFTPLVEPLSTCVYNLNNISIKPGDKVLVFGAGFMGSLNALVAKHMGASFTTTFNSIPCVNLSKASGNSSRVTTEVTNFFMSSLKSSR